MTGTTLAPVDRDTLARVRPFIEEETRAWGRQHGYLASNVDAVLREVFGPATPAVDLNADLAAVRAYVADTAIGFCRERGWCYEVNAGLTNVFGEPENQWRDAEGDTCNRAIEDEDFDDDPEDESPSASNLLANAIDALAAATESLRALRAGR